jgi:hypothetical protein
MTVEYYYNSTWNDISNYVVSVDKVPFVARNRDITIRLESWSLNIAITLNQISPFNAGWTSFAQKERIRISDGATLLFTGYIITSPYDYSSMEFNVTTITDLNKLQDYLVDYDTLHSAISGGSPSATEYRPYSYYIMPTVHWTYLIKKMFLIAGLTLDTSTIDDIIAFPYTWVELGGITMDVTFKDFFTGESELYCLEHSVNAYHTIIDSELYDHKKDKITFFNLINAICSALGLAVNLTTTDNYALAQVILNESYTVIDDDKFEYAVDQTDGEEPIDKLGVSVDFDTYPDTPSYCLSGTNANTNPTAISYGEGGGLDWFAKLRIMWIKEITTFDTSKVVPISSCVKDGTSVDITTVGAHGLGSGDPLMVYGVAGMDDLNNSLIDGTNYTAIDWHVYPNNVVTVAKDLGTSYIEGGWIYKDTGSNRRDDYRWGYLIPGESVWVEGEGQYHYSISENALLADGKMNPVYWQIKSKISDYTKKETLTNKQTTTKTILENNIDAEWENSELIEETYE